MRICWLENNYMKLNIYKCQLLVSGLKCEQNGLKLGMAKIRGSVGVKPFGIKIDNNLKFENHVPKWRSKANRELRALSRLTKFCLLKSDGPFLKLLNPSLNIACF